MAAHDHPTPEAPVAYGRYELLELIGIGGMAEVFRARLPGVLGFEKPVVIKRLQARFQNDHRFKRMFVEEAKLASQVQHKNVVQVFELANHGGQLFMVLEYIHGTDLKRLIRKAALNKLNLPVWLSVHITIEVLEALAFAHDLRDKTGQRRNLVHCDVTPENIFLSTSGEVKLADFGVAHDDTRAEEDFPGEIRGKLAYMAPEQLSGRRVDQRADVFSAAVVLWEALTQRRLFKEKNDDATVARIFQGERPRASRFNSGVPASLDLALLAALQADPTRRTRSARELQRALMSVQAELRHQVALSDVERVLRKVLSASESSDPETSDSGDVPTVERELAAAARPAPTDENEPTGDSLTGGSSNVDIPFGSAVTLPPTGMPSPSSSAVSRPETFTETPTPPASLAEGWAVALTGATPPRLPPARPQDLSPLAWPPMPGGPSQVETADIVKSPLGAHRRAVNPPVRIMGEVSPDTPGLWLRRSGGSKIGPEPVNDALVVLCRLLLDSPNQDAQVSTDGETWRDGALVARLLGEEVVPPDGALPSAVDRGALRDTSLVALFGRLSRTRRSGRLIIVLSRPGKPERFELHIEEGRLFHVASSRSLFNSWRSLLFSPHIDQRQLHGWLRQVIDLQQPFELVAAPSAVEAIRAQQAHFAQSDLQTLFAEREGRYAFAPLPSPPFPNGSGHALLTLVPSLVSRAWRTPELERRLFRHISTPIERSPDFEVEAGQLGLSFKDASALDRFVTGEPLGSALADPSDSRQRKLTLVLAYTLLELGLLRPHCKVSP